MGIFMGKLRALHRLFWVTSSMRVGFGLQHDFSCETVWNVTFSLRAKIEIATGHQSREVTWK